MAVVPACPLAGRAPKRVWLVDQACREAGLARAVHRATDLIRVRVRVRVRERVRVRVRVWDGVRAKIGVWVRAWA